MINQACRIDIDSRERWLRSSAADGLQAVAPENSIRPDPHGEVEPASAADPLFAALEVSIAVVAEH